VDISFGEFVTARIGALRRFGLVLTGNPHDGDDVVQAALVRVGMRWNHIRHDTSAKPYIRTTMVRLYLNDRTRRRHREVITDQLDAVPTAAGPDVDLRTAVWRALQILPPRQRAVIVLRYYEQLTEAETADALQCSRGTVKSQTAASLSPATPSMAPMATCHRCWSRPPATSPRLSAAAPSSHPKMQPATQSA
jgi:RNA polymerase sigma-70 factor (sigma-E family)